MAGSGKNEQWESMMEVVADNAALLTAVGAVAAVSILYACTGAPANTSTATTDTTDTKSPEDVAGGATALADKKKRKRAKKKAAAVANEVEEVVKESSDDESQDANKETVETAASKKKKKKNKKKANSGGDAPEEVSSGGQVKVNKKSSTQKAGSGAKTSKADAALKQALAEAQRDEREAAKERRKKAEAEEEAWESVSTTKSKPRKKKSTAAPESDASDAGKSKVLVKIPTDKIGVIIGPGGATLHKLQDATGTRINIPQSDAAKNYEREKTVTIEGLQEGTFACSKAIKDLAAKGFSTITHGEFSEASVQVFADYMSVNSGSKPLLCLQEAFEFSGLCVCGACTLMYRCAHGCVNVCGVVYAYVCLSVCARMCECGCARKCVYLCGCVGARTCVYRHETASADSFHSQAKALHYCRLCQLHNNRFHDTQTASRM
eukprot:m.1420097 g.1420097  ORF g.1420097 m.1420097 type:complete len:436 (-) comp25045_c1_seq2:33-1340(-)